MVANVRRKIQDIFAIRDCNSQDNYLGLLTLVGRNKWLTFDEIKDRVWNKVHNWKSNLFSFRGKKVLIKVVARAIPTYTMSIFQLSISLCKDLSAMISKFW